MIELNGNEWRLERRLIVDMYVISLWQIKIETTWEPCNRPVSGGRIIRWLCLGRRASAGIRARSSRRAARRACCTKPEAGRWRAVLARAGE